MGDLRIIVLSRDDGEFYPTLGPFLGRRDIIKELGSPLYDDTGKKWFVVCDGDRVVGFAAALVQGKYAHLCSAWVDHAYRGKGLHGRLLSKRIAWAQSNSLSISTVANQAAAKAYRKHGFVERSRRGRYVSLVKESK